MKIKYFCCCLMRYRPQCQNYPHIRLERLPLFQEIGPTGVNLFGKGFISRWGAANHR